MFKDRLIEMDVISNDESQLMLDSIKDRASAVKPTNLNSSLCEKNSMLSF